MLAEHQYIAIDLKSFYASVECVERGLDPLETNLVVADLSRTEKTICLAVTPSLKAYGIGGRARLFEVVQRVRQINAQRRRNAPYGQFTGESANSTELQAHPELAVTYHVAPPRMAYYINYSARIYSIYMKYVAPEDIHVYSVDEVFMDVTNYLGTYKITAHELARRMVNHVLRETGITATAGIGTNLYLCKVAMDIVAKHIPADKDGVRIAELDEMSYRRLLWNHRPLTDFWRVGHGIAHKLEACGMKTMGDVARRSLEKEEQLYKLFGVNAELLIDHAWGWEPCTIAAIKAYRPKSNSFSSGQVLSEPYPYGKARIVMREMADAMALKLVSLHMVAHQVSIFVNYDTASLKQDTYTGEVVSDYYGRPAPKPAHGGATLPYPTSSARLITETAMQLFDQAVNPKLLVRRLTIVVNQVVDEEKVTANAPAEQLDMFADYEALARQREAEQKALDKERRMQEAVLTIKRKFSKNAILKGMNLEEGATARDRNRQIGGHKA
ncbi:MAG: DNA methylase [Bacteroidales bacterium]|nr:DNA methylase [Bacteroidales bacterium]